MITVNQAIQRGIWMIRIPMFAIVFAMLIIGLYFAITNNFNALEIGIIAVFSILISISYTLFAVPKWKIWAFGNVRNVHELRKKAEFRNLVNPENSLLSKLEFYSKSDKIKWQKIRKKFDIPDTVNTRVVNSVEIYNSDTKLLLPIILRGLLFLGCAILMVSDKEFLVLGFIPIIILGIFLYFDFENFRNRKNPVITLSLEGLKTRTEAYKWSEIKGEKLVTAYPLRSLPAHFLDFRKIKNDEVERIDIDKIEISRNELFDYLIYFRHQFESQKK